MPDIITCAYTTIISCINSIGYVIKPEHNINMKNNAVNKPKYSHQVTKIET